MNNEQKEKLGKILKHFGGFFQAIKCIEEMSELQQALSKLLINQKFNNFDKQAYLDYQNITEEMADVEIMINQMKILFNNHKDVEEIINAKIERTINLIDSERK